MRIDNLRCSSSFYSLQLKLNKINKKIKKLEFKIPQILVFKVLIFLF